MNKLNELISKCKGSVSIEVNGHTDCYESISEYLSQKVSPWPSKLNIKSLEELDISIIKLCMMEKLNHIVEITFYPHTPISCYTVYHYNLDLCVGECLRVLKEKTK